MSEVVALMLFVILLGIAALHLYWAFGGLWPGKDEASLVRMVVGAKGMQKMPGKALTIIVAGLIALAGLLPLIFAGLLSDPISPLLPIETKQLVRTILLAGLAIVFLGRGLLSYTPYFTKMQAKEPFVTLDRRYYAPLCLLLGAGFLLLLVSS